MLGKVLMRECFYQIFQSEGGSYEKKYLHFHCKRKEKHVLFVLFCNWHPYGANSSQEMSGQKCPCSALTHDEICGFCIHVKYILNFRCLKLSVKKIPKILADCVQATPQYFAEIKSCEKFFFFDKNSNTIETILDNPKTPKITAQTDHIFMS